MFEPTIRAIHVGKYIGQAGEAIRVNLDAGGDSFARMGALDE
jgi:hypothetical protein